MIDRIIPALPEPEPKVLAEARRVAASRAEHDRLAAELPCLHAIEWVAPPQPRRLGRRIRIAAWNAERCKYIPESAALLAGIGADIVLLTELDIGMARSGNRHTVRELARSLGCGYAFGVEYVELGLGDDREKAWHADQVNAVGLHGNAVLGKASLEAPVIVRLDEGARWFAGAQSTRERRIGARMAIAAAVDLAGAPLVVASVHLESSTDPVDRAAQVAVLLRALDAHAPGTPVVIGGDFNTSDLPPADAANGNWFENPAAHEPLFGLFAEAGYDWRAANAPAATERTRPDGTPQPPFRKIDWFFSRGVAPRRAFTLAATDLGGSAISDHDIIVIDIEAR
ncbi:MAG TPA: endonuclease/exonuclease/phosphatase family protein [Dongiaceae bacterium]|jgi:endonuclease/exonuclease/phosphatase family metal-dependent hydrolase|nr:endonuclease/exonuclease/phosphatase family protein [Dongiaceae bacterium]